MSDGIGSTRNLVAATGCAFRLVSILFVWLLGYLVAILAEITVAAGHTSLPAAKFIAPAKSQLFPWELSFIQVRD